MRTWLTLNSRQWALLVAALRDERTLISQLFILMILAATVTMGGCQDLDVFDPSVKSTELFRDPSVVKLVDAAKRGDVEEVDRLISNGVDPNARGYRNATPLFLALESGNKDGYLSLLRHGADPNVLTQLGFCVVNRAAETDDPYWLREALLHGGDPDIVNKGTVHQPSATPLYYAISGGGKNVMREIVRNEHVRLLIAAGCDVNAEFRYRGEGGSSLPSSAASGQQSYSILLMFLVSGSHFKGFPESVINRWEKMHIEGSGRILEFDHNFADQRRSYLKVVDYLNERGANISLSADIRKAIEDKVDDFTIADLKYPTEIDFNGESYSLAKSETSYLDAITLIFTPKTPADQLPTKSIEITIAPGTICAATEAAAKTLEFRRAHKSADRRSRCEIENDSNDGAVVSHQFLGSEFFEMAIQRFEPLRGTKGYQRLAFIQRVAATHNDLDSQIAKLQKGAAKTESQWRNFPPPLVRIIEH